MHCTREVCENVYWVGGNDRRLAMFEGVYSVPSGVSYNSYVIMDERIAVCDTVDAAVSRVYFENLDHVLFGRKPDYLIVHHMEPDHAATLDDFVRRYPMAKIVCNAKTLGMIKQFFDFDIDSRVQVVNEGDTLSLGEHSLTFLNAPMVHWPEVMMSYEAHDKILFSADAFGTFGALNGALFADEVDFDRDYLDEARRYYTNIVGKYGMQVTNALKKAARFDIKYICSLHGFVWRENIGYFIEKYQKWASYTPEREGVMIAYASVYGNTANAAEILSAILCERGVETVMYDVSVTPASDIIAAAFKYSHAVFASTTYNAGIFVTMEELLRDIAAHNIQNRTVAFIQNGSWAPASAKQMREILETVKNTNFIESVVDVRSSVKQTTLYSLYALADEIESTLEKKTEVKYGKVDIQSLNSISYGLFALFTNDGKKDNACIINTASQVTVDPLRISICVNKSNYTAKTLSRTGIFNLSVLGESAKFDIFKQLGFVSGRDQDKLCGIDFVSTSQNGLKYLNDMSNAYISGKVIKEVDLDTHILYIADVTEAQFISNEPSCTYAYYHENIKQKPSMPECRIAENEAEIDKTDAPTPAEKKIVGWVCKICGYYYDGEVLPDSFTCPLCKHPASDFEPVWG